MDYTAKKKKEKKDHTANFIVSRFLMSKYSRKEKYDLNLAKRGLLRYIGDCIDLTYKKHKRFQAKISQSQIATQNGVERKTINRLSKQLVKKKLLKFDDKRQIYSFGLVLIAYTKLVHPKEVSHFGIGLRSESFCPTSNSSNSSNTEVVKNEEEIQVVEKTIDEKIKSSEIAQKAIDDMRQLIKKMAVSHR